MPKLTTEKFIEKAKSIHGDKFGYELVHYTGTHNKIKIMCKDHGEFEQMATNHISGYGCPNRNHIIIKNTKKLTTEEFIHRAEIIHNNYYNYSISEYKNANTKIKIICPAHGLFEQGAKHHLQGCNCPHRDHKNFNNISIEEFKRRAYNLYENQYDYSLVNYKSIANKIDIICKDHGLFNQIGADHLTGHGCQKCGNVYRRNTDDFIHEAMNIHGNRYDYSLTEYINSRSKVKILCQIHGLFKQNPIMHLTKHGCPRCSSSISISEIDWLNSLGVPEIYRQSTIQIDGKFYKPDAYNPETNEIWEFYGDYWHGNPKVYSPDKLHQLLGISHGFLYQKTLKREAILKKNGFKLISIWESDWKLFCMSLES